MQLDGGTFRGVKSIQRKILCFVVSILLGLNGGQMDSRFVEIQKEEESPRAKLQKNLHIIRAALERFALDYEGFYPLFLAGGERYVNMLYAPEDALLYREFGGVKYRVTLLAKYGPTLPIAKRGKKDTGYCISEKTSDGEERIFCADPLLLYGYLSQYPENPYVKKEDRILFSQQSPLKFPAGGVQGNRMWDVGLGWGDAPILDIQPPRKSKPISLVGNFYYHPIFCDGFAVLKHLMALLQPESSYGRLLKRHEVCGYVLLGFAPKEEGGLDVTRVMPEKSECAVEWLPRISLARKVLTGYFSLEYDPYACLPPGDEIGKAGSGPDGESDLVAFILIGRGVERKPRSQYFPPPTTPSSP